MVDLREIVFANLDCAADNGAFEVGGYLSGAKAEEIADDMVSMASDCEDYQPGELVPFVEEWLRVRKQKWSQ